MKIKNLSIGIMFSLERLNNQLKLIKKYPLTVIEAPMGYGKTTAIKEYLKHVDASVLWQTVYDEYTNNFWYDFCMLFMDKDQRLAKKLLDLSLPNDSVSRELALSYLLSLMDHHLTFLVFDDYHFVVHPEIHSFITFLIKKEIAHLHIIIMARLVRLEQLEELKLKDYAHHLTKEDFELKSGEIIQYYRECGILLNNQEVDTIHRYSEGWISALYLLMLDMVKVEKGEEKREQKITLQVEPLLSIYALVDQAIYQKLPAILKEFLLCVCHFDHFSLEQAVYMWGDEAPTLLEDILSRNVFVAYNLREKSYHIHNILRSFLLEQLDKKDQQFKKNIYHRSAIWYEKKKDYYHAMCELFQSDDFDKLLHLVERDKTTSMTTETASQFFLFFDSCPIATKAKHPMALLMYALYLFTLNDFPRFEAICSEFEVLVLKNTDLPKDEKDQYQGEYEIIQSFTKYNDISEMYPHYERAVNLLTRPSLCMPKDGSWTMGSPSVLCLFYRKPGSLRSLVHNIRQALPLYYKLTEKNGYGGEYALSAERYYLQGDFLSAQIEGQKALVMGSELPSTGVYLCAYFIKIRVSLALGDFSDIPTYLQQLKEDTLINQDNQFVYMVDMVNAYVYSQLGEISKVPRWIQNGEIFTDRIFFHGKPFLNCVYGRVLLIEGSYVELIGISEYFISTSSIFPNLVGLIYTHIYLAAANMRLFREKEAKLALLTALELALEDSLYMPFVENCDFILSLLQDVGCEERYKQDIRHIIGLYEQYKVAILNIHHENYDDPTIKLTDREKEIIRLAVKGLTNKEIGATLFISPNTVKSQLKSIFEKLEINSRSLLANYVDKLK